MPKTPAMTRIRFLGSKLSRNIYYQDTRFPLASSYFDFARIFCRNK